MNTNPPETQKNNEFSNKFNNLIEQQKKEIKNNPKKAITIILANILWYFLTIMLILYIISYPYQCQYKDENYTPIQYKNLALTLTNDPQSTYNNGYLNPKCEYNIKNYKTIFADIKEMIIK